MKTKAARFAGTWCSPQAMASLRRKAKWNDIQRLWIFPDGSSGVWILDIKTNKARFIERNVKAKVKEDRG